MNIIDYVNLNYKTFDEKPFSNVDSLILSELAYLDYKGYVKSLDSNKGITIGEIARKDMFLISNRKDVTKIKELIKACARSPRFQNLKIKYYHEVNNKEKRIQFGAITFCHDKFIYVSYRGTNGTLTGWLEDFDMTKMFPIKSQNIALYYLETVISKTNKPVYVGGHSKGGNLAVFSVMYLEDNRRVKKVFSHEGPGFFENVVESDRYQKTKKLINKTVTESSIIGVLLQEDIIYTVVRSSGVLVNQHDPFTWIIEGNHFSTKNSLNLDARFLKRRVDKVFDPSEDYGNLVLHDDKVTVARKLRNSKGKLLKASLIGYSKKYLNNLEDK